MVNGVQEGEASSRRRHPLRPQRSSSRPLKQWRLPRAQNWEHSYKRTLGLADALGIVVATAATYLFHFGDEFNVRLNGGATTYAVVAPPIAVWWWLSLHWRGSRDRGVIGHGLEEYRRVIASTMWVFASVAIASYFLGVRFSRGFFIELLPVGLAILLLGRWAARRALHRRRAKGGSVTPTVVVGSSRDIAPVLRDLRQNINAGYRPVAVALSAHEMNGSFHPEEYAGLPVIDLDAVADHVAVNRVGAVVVVPGLPRARIRELAWALESSNARLMFVPSLLDVAGPRLAVHQVQDLSLLSVDLPRFSGWSHLVKRSFDVVFSLGALVAVAPVMAAAAILIKAEDGGPVLFRQERIGRGGQPFVVHKFRTMCVDAEAKVDALIAAAGGRATLFKMENDPRITKIGKVLRKYSLDELPQFWTVLKGGMSVVGPRPQVEREVAEYAPATHRRLLIKPGITGLWQVNGRSKLSVEESVRLDLRYVENWSLAGDLAIVMRTVRVVATSSGAY